MNSLAASASIATGTVLVLLTLREMFHELFHPAGSGSLGAGLRRGLWQGFRMVAKRRRSVLVLAGPGILVTTVVVWTLLLGVGWALVFWPFLPEGFRFGSPLAPAEQAGLLDALYFSFVTLATLGYGDISPTGAGLRLLAPLEAAVGFALLTAGISWILSVYPVLGRRRAFAQRLASLHRLQQDGAGVLDLEPDTAHRVLDELAAALAQVRADLVQSTISYYFTEDDEGLSLPVWLPFAERLATDAASETRAPAVRHAGRLLGDAVSAYAAVLRGAYLKDAGDTTAGILEAYASDHLRRTAA